MKLRNKKTGEIIDIDIIENRKDGSWEWQAGKTLHDFNREWEDYTPKEPLIKDEKKRKLLADWYELVSHYERSTRVLVTYLDDVIYEVETKNQSSIEIPNLGIEGGEYDITDLIGEGEE